MNWQKFREEYNESPEEHYDDPAEYQESIGNKLYANQIRKRREEEMPTFKLIVTTMEEWEHHYEIEAEDLETAKEMVQEESLSPDESHRNEINITGIIEP